MFEYTRSEKPSENLYIEGFNSRFRDESLNEHWFVTIPNAQATIETWRASYNDERPHSSLNNLTPNEFLKEQQNFYANGGLNKDLAQKTG